MEENTAPPSISPPPASPPPPPLPPPPVIVPPTPAPARRRGRGWMVFALIVLGISVLFNLGHFMRGLVPMNVSGVRAVGPRLEEVTTEDNDSALKIAVVHVDGIITDRALDQGGFGMVEVIKSQLKRAAER